MSCFLQNSIAGGGFRRKLRTAAAFIGYKDSAAPPDGLVKKVLPEHKQGPAQLRATIRKIEFGNGTTFYLIFVYILSLVLTDGPICLRRPTFVLCQASPQNAGG